MTQKETCVTFQRLRPVRESRFQFMQTRINQVSIRHERPSLTGAHHFRFLCQFNSRTCDFQLLGACSFADSFDDVAVTIAGREFHFG